MKRKDEKEFISLNSELPAFFVEELEQRLETDPLMVGGLLDLVNGSEGIQPYCGNYGTCGDFMGCAPYTHCSPF